MQEREPISFSLSCRFRICQQPTKAQLFFHSRRPAKVLQVGNARCSEDVFLNSRIRATLARCWTGSVIYFPGRHSTSLFIILAIRARTFRIILLHDKLRYPARTIHIHMHCLHCRFQLPERYNSKLKGGVPNHVKTTPEQCRRRIIFSKVTLLAGIARLCREGPSNKRDVKQSRGSHFVFLNKSQCAVKRELS